MIMSTPTEEAPAPQEAATFSLLDRCDACGAAAQAKAEKPGRAALLFCGHHSNDHGPALMADGWIVKR